MNQRWRARRDYYRRPDEQIDTRLYDVAELHTDAPAKAFVLEHHYSGSYPAARWRFGLYRAGQLVGVAVFSHPCNDRVITTALPVSAAVEGVELGRFVLLDDVPGNGETWFLGRCFAELRRRVAGVVAFSDPLPRRDAAGRVLTPGHVGTIYQAHNGVYLGRGTVRTLRLLPDGRTFSARAASKIRRLERGWRYAAAQLEAAGAAPLVGSAGADPSPEEAARWLGWWLPAVTRTVRHPGNHRYVWSFARRSGKGAGGAYPKAGDGAPLLAIGGGGAGSGWQNNNPRRAAEA